MQKEYAWSIIIMHGARLYNYYIIGEDFPHIYNYNII